jgi:mycoredoxin
MSDDTVGVTPSSSQPAAITVYWRPGCGACSALLRQLDRLGVRIDTRDIWEDPTASARVRQVAGGHETVPTVFVGDVPLVNPTPDDVMRTAAAFAPELVPAGYVPKQPGKVASWLLRLLRQE